MHRINQQARSSLIRACAILIMVGCSPAVASLSGLIGAWGHDFAVSPFEPKELMVATVTDKKTGDQFNLIKMPSGKLMAGIPIDQVKDAPKVQQVDMVK